MKKDKEVLVNALQDKGTVIYVVEEEDKGTQDKCKQDGTAMIIIPTGLTEEEVNKRIQKYTVNNVVMKIMYKK